MVICILVRGLSLYLWLDYIYKDKRIDCEISQIQLNDPRSIHKLFLAQFNPDIFNTPSLL